jgi:Protein of unknown function (DUF1592)/Protein of unknown function (DUF1588)/Protein of unknown function (DUF1585)/Protein of unknown function (DUF1587)/Protein of unknown function (DUF1595)
VAAHAEVWEKVVRKLRVDLMPPPGGARPESAQVDELVASLESYLDHLASERGPEPGRVPLHRLNRTEYATAVEDLLAVHIDAAGMLPADISSEGFDNVAEVLRVSPTHLDQYIAAARDISILAVGNPAPDPARADYRSDQANKTRHVDGLPLGTRDGLVVEHDFPADGDYELNLTISSIPGSELRGYPYGWLEYAHEVVVTLDGVSVFMGSIGGTEDSLALDQRQIQGVDEIRNRFRNIRVPVTAGPHEVGAAFVARSFAEGDYLLQSQLPGEGVPDVPRLYGMEIIGPFNPTGISGTTRSRERIFICTPQTETEERPCAERILANLAHQAFRRPVDAADLEPVLGFYSAAREAGGSFDVGIQKGLMAILASTKFLYRAEPGSAPADPESGAGYAISDLELAWRLSFFLWSQGPDAELLGLAEAGQLSEKAVLERQVGRMLADGKSRSLVTNFAFQWLDVRRLGSMDPDPRLYPAFDEDLRYAFGEEMELFLDSVLRGGGSVLDLLTADHTFVNERLARHYGIQGVRGDQFRRVVLDDPKRFGLFGKGSVLMVTSYPDRTSPVLRGAWIMEHVLATPPNPPPPEVETDLAPVAGDVPRSVRERLELHRTVTSCNHCHGVIDPLGQALENFDAVGEWRVRERDNGVPIDSTGRLAGGVEVNGPEDLRRALLAEPKLLVQALTEKLMTYALGRGLQYYDMPMMRSIVAASARADYSFESIVLGVVQSPAFTMRGEARAASGPLSAGAPRNEVVKAPAPRGD